MLMTIIFLGGALFTGASLVILYFIMSRLEGRDDE